MNIIIQCIQINGNIVKIQKVLKFNIEYKIKVNFMRCFLGI